MKQELGYACNNCGDNLSAETMEVDNETGEILCHDCYEALIVKEL